MGRRYYKRVDAHITDFFYWNPSGLGAGIENIDIAGMKLSYAAFVVDGPSVGVMGNPMIPLLPVQNVIGVRNDVQLRGIPLYAGGELRVGLSAIVNYSDSSTNTHHGFSGVVQHVQQALGGANELSVAYGMGPGTGLGSADSLTNSSDVKRLRILDAFGLQPFPWLGGQLLFVYQRDDFVAGSQNWLSAGGRLAFALVEHAKLLVEIGHDNVKPSDMSARSLTKFTIAPAIVAAKAFWSRPELRLFYTFATWNAASREAGVDSGDIFKSTNKTNGSSFGIHAESWW
jgi:maltoporin